MTPDAAPVVDDGQGREAIAFSQRLLTQVASPQDEVLLKEALACLKAGALRAAYITTWLAVAESIKEKFRVMSVRDSQISRIAGEIEKRESDERAVDRYLLGKAKEIGLLAPEDAARIGHLYTMRGIYAHPYRVAPSAEEVRAAMVAAVDGVLAHPPFLRHGYINQLLDLLLTNRHYLDDVETKVVAFATEVSTRILPTLRGYLLATLCKRLEAVVDDPDLAIFRRRAVWFARAFLAAVDARLDEPGWESVELMARFPRATSAVLSSDALWQRLPGQGQDTLLGEMLFPAVGPAAHDALEMFHRLDARGLLSKRQADRFREAVAASPLATLAETDLPLDLYGGKIVDRLASRHWYTQNPAIAALENIGPGRAAAASPEMQEQLGRNILQAAEGYANDAEAFMRRVAAGTARWPQHVVQGMILECFVNDDDQFRLKSRFVRESLLAAIRGRLDGPADIYYEVSERIRRAESKDVWYRNQEFSTCIGAIEDVIGELTPDERAYEVDLNCLLTAIRDKWAEMRRSRDALDDDE